MKTVQKTGRGRELYRVVVTYVYANGPFTVPSVPMDRAVAMNLFDCHVKSGAYSPDRNRRVRVMAEAECERWGYR